MKKRDIKETSVTQLADWLEHRGVRPYRAGQILRWVYTRQLDDFQEMTDLGRSLRHELAESFGIGRLGLLAKNRSRDGSCKFLFGLQDGETVETVLIPERDHLTLCISSQVGCAMGCRFCATGSTGLVRNLSRGEIVAQVRDVLNALGPGDAARLRNIVLMGMGEPLANYTQVIGALETLTDTQAGFGFAGRRITLSTVGLVPRIAELGRDTSVNLAVSLNAADNATRDRLMPVNRQYPIETLLAACRQYPLKARRRITFAYVLIGGVNDAPEDARRLVKILRPLRAKINLIPFNQYPESPFRRPDEPAVLAFQEVLVQHHFTAIIRWSKGEDIAAACGLLRAASARPPAPDGGQRLTESGFCGRSPCPCPAPADTTFPPAS